jgi:TPR repeat protein
MLPFIFWRTAIAGDKSEYTLFRIQGNDLIIHTLVVLALLLFWAPYTFADAEAVDALKKKFESQSDAWFHYALGVAYFNGTMEKTDYLKAAQMFRKSAEQGLAEGQCQLGRMYNSGLGVPQDFREAAVWFLKAAEQGQAECQTALAAMYEKGQGVSKDTRQALHWFSSAAENGNAIAQMKLGLYFLQGESVPQDYVQAHMWLNLAAAQNEKSASDLRDTLSTQMTAYQVAEAQRFAWDWIAKHTKRR